MAEGHRRHVCMDAQCCVERQRLCRDLRIDPELVMKTLIQLQARLNIPGEPSEDLVLLVGSRKLGVGARLAVVVAQVLVSRKEPYAIVTQRTAEIRRNVAILIPLVSAECLGARNSKPCGLAGQSRPLSIIGSIVREIIASMSGENVDHGALDVAEFSRCSHTLNLDFLNHVRARLGARDAGAWAGEVRSVDKKQV